MPDDTSDDRSDDRSVDKSDDKPDAKNGGKLRPDAISLASPDDKSDGNSNDKPDDKPDDKSNGKDVAGTGGCSCLALRSIQGALPPELQAPRPALPRLDDPALAKALVRLAEVLSAPTGCLERP